MIKTRAAAILTTALAGLLLLALPGIAAAESPYAVYKSEATFDDVMQGLKMAIEEQGLYINNMMHMGEMLERTGKDLGDEQQLYLKAESIESCSAINSRKMIAENPHRIVNCPFIMSVYILPQEPEIVYIVHRRLNLGDDSPVMQEVEAMLEGLAEAAAEGF